MKPAVVTGDESRGLRIADVLVYTEEWKRRPDAYQTAGSRFYLGSGLRSLSTRGRIESYGFLVNSMQAYRPT